jgi:hypothetical protein
MGGEEHLGGGEIRSGSCGRKHFGQRPCGLNPVGREVYPAVGQLFGVANEKNGGRRLRFRGGGSPGVNYLRRTKRQKTGQQQKENAEAELNSDRCHVARIAACLFHSDKTG